MLQKFNDFINEKKQVIDPRTVKVRESLPKEIWHELLGFQKEIMRNEVDSEEFFDFCRFSKELIGSGKLKYWKTKLSNYRTLPDLIEYVLHFLPEERDKIKGLFE